LKLVSIILFLWISSLYAVEVGKPLLQGEELTLPTALKIAEEKNPRLQMYKAKVKVSDAEKMKARGELFPSLSFKGGYRQQSQDSYATKNLGEQTDSPVERDKNYYSLSAETEMLLYSGGGNWAGFKASDSKYKSMQEQYDLEKREIFFRVKEIFYKTLIEKEKIKFLEDMYDSIKTHYKIVEKKFEARVILKTELLASESEVLSVEQKLTEAENDYKIALCQLNGLLGEEKEWEIDGELKCETKEVDRENAKAEVLSKFPEIKMVNYEVKAAEAGLEMANAFFYRPKLKLMANYSLSENKWVPEEKEWSAGIGMELPFFTGGKGMAEVKKGKANLEQAEKYRKFIEGKVLLNFEQAFLEFEKSWKVVKVAEKRREQAKENLRISKAAFSAGTVSNEGVLRASRSITESEISYLESLYFYNISYARLNYFVGE